MHPHAFLLGTLEHLRGTLERKRARLEELRAKRGVRPATKRRVAAKQEELDGTIDALESLIARVRRLV